MFGRKSSPEPTPSVEESATSANGGKGRPTPSRKEAEAARKARVRPARTRKEQAARARQLRMEQGDKVRQAMKTGDERYLPARDRGPVKRFIRDWIDSRFTLGEILVPLLIVTLVLGFVGNPAIVMVGQMVTMAILLMLILNVLVIRFALRRQLQQRFPDEAPWRGTTYYAVMRSMQIRLLRLPKPQRKIGEKLPERYR